MREIAHGLEGSDKPMMIIPCGTENLLANELGYDERIKTILKTFEQGHIEPLDLCKANGKSFTSICGVGFDGQIVKLVDANRSGHINHLDYFWPIWRIFWNHKFPQIKVELNGEEIFNGQGLVFAGNISRYAIGLQISHYADYGDGLFDVCIYKCKGRLHLLKHALMTVLKKHADCKDVIYKQGTKAKISSNFSVETELDGDPGPHLPLQITIEPQAVKVVVPKDAKPAGIRTRIIRMLG